jgi:hypothetical protein
MLDDEVIQVMFGAEHVGEQVLRVCPFGSVMVKVSA